MAHNLFDITGRHALVTGSGSGIGLGMAEGLLEAGCKVVLHSHSQLAVQECSRLREKGFDVEAVTGDLSDVEDTRRVFKDALTLLDGRIDILVNCAGAQARYDVMDFPLDKFEEVMNVNNRAAFILSQLAAENMLTRNYGKIINVASMQSWFGGNRTAAYSASKGAIAQLTKSFGNELASRGISVNAIAPGWVATKLTQAVVDDQERSADIGHRIPIKRWGSPDDFKGPVIFLASAASDFLSGAVIPVDGGYPVM